MTADPRKFGQVALVVGGDSGEREVSLRGGQAVAQAMDRLGIDYSLVDGAHRLLEQVAAGHFDRVFNLLHGPGGEDRSEEHTSELQSRGHLVCRLLLEKKKSSQTLTESA